MKEKHPSYRIPWRGSCHAPFWVLALSLLYAAGCATSKSPAVAEPAVEKVEEPSAAPTAPPPASEEVNQPEASVDRLFEAVGIAFLEPVLPVGKQGSPSEKFIQASGVGLPAKGVENAAQKKLTAMEAARYRALANLAEELLGQEVSREALVVDMAFAGEEIQANLAGKLKGTSEVSRIYDEKTGLATVVLRVVPDPQGNGFRKPAQPLSPEQRKSRAETAARIHAAALLREQIGQVYVEQDIRVENLLVTYQSARVYMQGLLAGIQFSEPRWSSDEKCEVTASLNLDREQLDQLISEKPEGLPEKVVPTEME